MDAFTYIENKKGVYQDLDRLAARSGPMYNKNNLVWGDQIFDLEIPTAEGGVICRNPVRVGKTQASLDVILVASHNTRDRVIFEENSTVTLTLLGCDEREGEYSPVGPAICLIAPEGGIAAEADGLLARFAIGNTAAWIKTRLEFSGKITGGTVDCALSYMPR